MNRKYQLIALALAQIVLVLVLGLEGDFFTREFALTEERLLVAALLLVITLLAVTIRLVTPDVRFNNSTAFIIPLHWSAFSQLSLVAGLSIGLFSVQLFGDSVSFGSSHTYEVVGLLVGVLILLLLTLRREWQIKAAFAAGYGLGLPSIIMLMDRPNNHPLATYGGHLSIMLIAAGLVILFGRFVRIDFVD